MRRHPLSPVVLAVLAGLLAGCSADSGGSSESAPPGIGLSASDPGRSRLAAPAHRSQATTVPVGLQAQRRSFTLAASGDVLIHSGVRAQAQADGGLRGIDFLPMFAGVVPLMRGADLAICHLETPLAPVGGPFRGYPRFSAPPQVARALRQIGYDSCSTGSNHSLDQGARGVWTTLNALDAVGLRHAGTARSPAEALRTTLLPVKGVKVAQLSYSFGFNGLPLTRPYLANVIDQGRILAAAAAARRAGAQVVVVSLHWGTEYRHEPNSQQLWLAPRLLASPDVDLILGHHAHVVQPMQRIGAKWVVYGMGNLVAAKSHNRADGATHEGIVPRFTFTEQPGGRFLVTKVEVTPVYVRTIGPLRVVPASDGSAPARRAHYRSARIVVARGAGKAGLLVR